MSTSTPKLVRSRLSAALFAAMLLPAAGAAIAQDQDAPADQNAAQDQQQPATTEQKAKTLDKVVVTGSLIPPRSWKPPRRSPPSAPRTSRRAASPA